MKTPSPATTARRGTASRDIARILGELFWNEADRLCSSIDDDEVVRMIQLNGMIGFDPELAQP